MRCIIVAMLILGVCNSCRKRGFMDSKVIWRGDRVMFIKTDSADWRLDINQDRIVDGVWITRAENKGIFNIAVEDSFSKSSSPMGTRWALGSTAEDIEDLSFDTWRGISNNNPPSLINKDLVLHLIAQNIFIDIKFTNWTSGSQGGGFVYERSTKE